MLSHADPPRASKSPPAASVGKAVTLSFATSRAPPNSFENLASYSSQGEGGGPGEGVRACMPVRGRQSLQSGRVHQPHAPPLDPSSAPCAPTPRTGPTTDKRVKPDILAPGTITSAAAGLGSADDCGLTTMAVSGAVCVGGGRLVRLGGR